MNYIVLSSDKNFDYAFYCPIISRAWMKRGYRPLLLLVGSVKSWLADPHLRLALQRSREAGAVIHFVPEVDGVRTSTIAQCARIFGALVLGVDADDFLLISDIDMLPLGPWVGGGRDASKAMAIWFSNAYAEEVTKTGRPHWPMCYVGARSTFWRKIFGYSNVIRREADPARLIEALSAAMRFAPKDASEAWGFDEMYMSEHIASPNYTGEVQFIPRTFVEGEWRIDRSDWDGAMAQVLKRGNLDGVADAHLPRPGFGAGWEKIAPLFRLAFSPDDFAWCEEYHERWMEVK